MHREIELNQCQFDANRLFAAKLDKKKTPFNATALQCSAVHRILGGFASAEVTNTAQAGQWYILLSFAFSRLGRRTSASKGI